LREGSVEIHRLRRQSRTGSDVVRKREPLLAFRQLAALSGAIRCLKAVSSEVTPVRSKKTGRHGEQKPVCFSCNSNRAAFSGRPIPFVAGATRRQSLRSSYPIPCCAIGRRHTGRRREACKYRCDLRTRPRPAGPAVAIHGHQIAPTFFLVLPFHNLLTVAMRQTSPCD